MHSHLMFAVGVLILTLAISPLIGQESQHQAGIVEAQAGNFLVYRNAVHEYIMNHPAYTGVINESDLDLPDTFVNLGWSSRAASGEAWVYGDMHPSGLRRTVDQVDQPITLGRKESGVLISPVHGNTGIPVPSFIAAGQMAAVIKNI